MLFRSRRFGRRLDVEALRALMPVTPFFFDILRVDGEDLLDRPLAERLTRLDVVVSPTLRVPRLTTSDPDEARRFEADVTARGHEGIMAKLPTAPYAAGRRGSAWIKVRPPAPSTSSFSPPSGAPAAARAG